LLADNPRPTIGPMAAFTLFHVALSLAGILSGFVVVFGLLGSRRLDGWTALFLATTVATSVTGFLFPVHHLMPSHVLGIISIVVLSVTLVARYRCNLEGASRWIYAGGAVLSLYLNFFVLIAQSFAKIPALKVLAPTQSEPPFVVAQSVALVVFAALGIGAIIRFRPDGIAPASRV
jgi:hypothetical protein